MNIFLKDHLELIGLLNKHEVSYLLIGGYAVIFYGYRRTTGDMDLWLEPTNENKQKFANALHDGGFEEQDIATLLKLDFTTHQVFSIGNEPERIDFITIINQVSFPKAFSQKVLGEFEGIKIPVIHLNDLILSKLNTGRVKDAADIEELQRLRKPE